MTSAIPWMNSFNLRQSLSQTLSDGSTVAWYQPGVGVTGTLNASAWANQLGAAGSLAQATGANQPIYLPFTGDKYVYLPAVASNTVTTPTKTITGNFTKTYDLALNDYTPAADVTIDAKTSGNDGFSVLWLTTDKVRLVIGDGTGLTNVDVVAASSFTNGSRHTVTIDWDDGVGATFSYDGVQSGSQVAAVKTLTNAAVSWTLGSATSIGKVYDHTMTDSAATTYYHLNPPASAETSTNAATWVSDNGETYTLNNTGALPAQIVGSPSLLFDGTNDGLKTAGFTLNQPETIYLVVKPITWTDTDTIVDGNAGNDMRVFQTNVTPQIYLYAGAQANANAFLALNATKIITAQFNGASSTLQVDNNAASTGNPGAANGSGLTLGMFGDASGGWANIQVKELIVRSGADSAGTQAKIKSLLQAIHGTP